MVPAGVISADVVPAGMAPASVVPAGVAPAGVVPAAMVPASVVPAGVVPACVQRGNVAPESHWLPAGSGELCVTQFWEAQSQQGSDQVLWTALLGVLSLRP